MLIPKDEQNNTDETKGGHNKENVMLNIDTFKNMCMLVKTDKSKEIRKYYVKLENIYNKIIKEEIENKDKLLEEKEQLLIKQKVLIEELENKPDTEGFSINNGYIYLIRDTNKKGHYKIGLSEKPDKRLNGLNVASSTNSLEIVHKFKTKDQCLAEKISQAILFTHKIKKQKEWFYINNDNDKLLNFIIKSITESVEFSDKYTFNNINEQIKSLKNNENNSSKKNMLKCVIKKYKLI